MVWPFRFILWTLWKTPDESYSTWARFTSTERPALRVLYLMPILWSVSSTQNRWSLWRKMFCGKPSAKLESVKTAIWMPCFMRRNTTAQYRLRMRCCPYAKIRKPKISRSSERIPYVILFRSTSALIFTGPLHFYKKCGKVYFVEEQGTYIMECTVITSGRYSPSMVPSKLAQ